MEQDRVVVTTLSHIIKLIAQSNLKKFSNIIVSDEF